MKNIILVLILGCVGFISCDGRKSRSEALKASIAEFNEKKSDIVIVSYYPKEYTEVVTDTLISNKVRIYIKNYSLPKESLLMSVDAKAVPKNEKQHRVFESEIVISTPTKELLNTHISAELFRSKYSDLFWNEATLQHVWVNQELSTTSDIKLDMSFINPKDNSYKMYRLSINEYGQQQIDLIKERT